MKKKPWLWVSTVNWTGAFGLDKKGLIITTPSIAQWARGKRFTKVIKKLFLSDKLLDFKVYGWKDLDKPLDLDTV